MAQPTQTVGPATDQPRAATAASAVYVSDLRRSYPAPGRGRSRVLALDGVSLDVPAGQNLALLGPNGSGKSTLLKILATLDRPDRDSGPVHILGLDPAGGDARAIRARLGVVFQSPGLDGLLTVRENLRTAAALYGLSASQAEERIADVLSALSLTDRAADRVRTLSGGLARRVDLARALLHAPDLLLLDEPTAALDPRARAEFLATLAAVRAAPRPAGRPPLTIITSTHTMDEAERADRVVLLHRGRVIADDAPDALRRRIGGIVLRCRITDAVPRERIERLLRDAGLTPAASSAAANEITAAADRPESLERTLVALAREGVPFEVGPSTLGDVFLTLTGESLADTTETPAPPRHRRAS